MDSYSLTRSELYEKVWMTPISRLSKEFGISDVALAKTCRKYNIPRPPRGYWARIANGYKDPRSKLPKADNVGIKFDVERNRKNRKRIQAQQEKEKAQVEKVRPAIDRSAKVTHPLALKLKERLATIKPDKHGMLKLKRIGLPELEIAEDAQDRVIQFLSIVAYAATEEGIAMGKDSDDKTLRFTRDGFGVGLKISQALVKEEREPTLEEKRQPSWTWDLTTYRPSEKLTITLHSSNSLSGRRKWTESNSTTLLDLAPKIAARIDSALRQLEDARLAEIRRKKEWEEQQKRWEEERRIERHRKHIESIKKGRVRNLIHASMLWEERQRLLTFIEACRQHWGNEPSNAQNEWLKWAQDAAEHLNPFEYGYPDPEKHGPLNESTVPEDDYHEDEGRFVIEPKLLQEIRKLTEKRGYGDSSW